MDRLPPNTSRGRFLEPVPHPAAYRDALTRRSALSQSRTLYVGMAVHQESLALASVAQDQGAEGVSLGTSGPRQGDSDTLLRRLPSTSPPLVFVYAAGPCGAWLSRSRTKQGFPCWVGAPSL